MQKRIDNPTELFDREITRAIITRGLPYYTACGHIPEPFWIRKYLQNAVMLKPKSPLLIATIRATVERLLMSEKDSTDDNMWTLAAVLSEAVVHCQGDYAYGMLEPERQFDYFEFSYHLEDMLSAASDAGKFGWASLLLEIGTDCNTGSKIFGKALHCALLGNNNEIALLLLEAGANPKANNWPISDTDSDPDEEKIWLVPAITPFQAACYAGNEMGMALLLQPHLGIHTSRYELANGILSAIVGGHSDIAHSLIEDLEDLKSPSEKWKRRFWKSAMTLVCTHGVADMFDTVLDQGVSIGLDWHDMNKWVFRLAARHGFVEVVRRVLESGLDPQEHYLDGWVAVSAKTGFSSIIQLFIDHGIHLSSRLFVTAAEEGHDHIIQLLFDNGVPIHGPETQILSSGETATELSQQAYQCAVKQGHDSTQKLLLKLGVVSKEDEILEQCFVPFWAQVEAMITSN